MIHKRKGATMAEICIIMAVISIVSMSVVSFITMTSGRSAASIGRLEAIDDLELVETVVDKWFAQTTQPITIDEGMVKVDGLAAIRVDNKTLSVGFQGTDMEDYPLERVKALFFTYEESDTKDDVLYFCTVTYYLKNEDEEQIYTFCINPRVGETITPQTPTEDPDAGA